VDIQLIGHASVFVETKDLRILMDPVLWDPHQEGLFDMCPRRQVVHERLPEFDCLIISHRHLDHFDIETLAKLPKFVRVLIPQDELIESCLRELGYTSIYPLKDFSQVKFGETRILTTASENPVPEFGLVVSDESGVFWNQVDTEISQSTIRFVLSRYAEVDFLLAAWQPMLELSYQFNQDLSFPYQEYSRMLATVSLIHPRAVAPGANGFEYLNGSSWLNQVVFPVTREQFCKDVKLACPVVRENVFILDPGDILSLVDGDFCYSAGGSDVARCVSRDRAHLDFAPVKIGSDLIDHNPDKVDPKVTWQVVIEEVEVGLPEFINNDHLLFSEHRRWGIVYQLEVVLSDERCTWFFDFTEEQVEARRGRSPFANYFSHIAGSSLYGIIKRTKGWDHAMLGGYYRRSNKVYAVSPFGVARADAKSLSDPLELKHPYKLVFEDVLRGEIKKHLREEVAASSVKAWQGREMIKGATS
jgi:UDP-MurNAc hydroxylase